MAITYTWGQAKIARRAPRRCPDGAERLITLEEFTYLLGQESTDTLHPEELHPGIHPGEEKTFIVELKPGAYTAAQISALEAQTLTLNATDYGKKWRMWLGDPTEAQRSTRWDGEGSE